ncbi:MAG: alpha/beta hydrolase [Phycisphaeraceae bacterium]|nr:alpha/beta hydrolase [Phycisphaeraceae bacterium]
MSHPRSSSLSPPPTSSPGSPTTTEHVRTINLVGLSREVVPAQVVDIGEGRPIVFLHGLVGLNDHWEDVVRGCCHRLRATLLEIPLLQLRGDDCSIQGVEVLTANFLQQHFAGQDAPPPILVGNSFGGHVALRIALNRPDLVSGLVLAGASGLIEKTMVADVQIRPSREWLSRKIGELFYDPANHMKEADLDRAHKELSDRGGARAMVKLSRSARRNHLGDRIPEIQAPTLLIWGKQDIVTPPEAAEQFMSLLRDARIVWFDECGHAPMIEKPDQFAKALLDFATELDRRA